MLIFFSPLFSVQQSKNTKFLLLLGLEPLLLFLGISHYLAVVCTFWNESQTLF